MINQVVEQIIPYLQTLNFSDVVGGIATTITHERPNDTNDGVYEIKFPAYINSNKTTCNASDYIDLSPNDKKKSVMFFTDGGTQFEAINRFDFKVTSNVKLICWLNYKKINPVYKSPDLFVANTMQVIPDFITPVGIDIYDITAEFVNQDEKTAAIFGDYTFSEPDNQYLLYPFDYFALNYRLQYYVPRSCIDAITLNPSNC